MDIPGWRQQRLMSAVQVVVTSAVQKVVSVAQRVTSLAQKINFYYVND
jgi:hypothetical protein